MNVTATLTTGNPGNWVEDEDGFTIDPGKSWLAWGECAGAEHGFTVGIDEHDAAAAYVAQTLADVVARFPGQSVDDEWTEMGARHFEFSPDAAWVSVAGSLRMGTPHAQD